MDCAHEDGSEKNPQDCRHPAPDDTDGRAHNGACAGNGREVMAKHDPATCGHIVHTIVELRAGDIGFGVDVEDSFGQELTIGMIGQDVPAKAHAHQYQSVHKAS